MPRRITTGLAASLLNFFGSAYALQAVQRDRASISSKRHPVEETSTGRNAASTFLARRRLTHSARSLRKLDRANRIHAGTAILKYGVPGRREIKMIQRAEDRFAAELAA